MNFVVKNKMSNRYVLDASALIALINKEPGGEKVVKILPRCIMSAINLSESAAVLSSISMPYENIKNILAELVREIIPFDAEQAFETAFLRDLTKNIGLSLGDRACIALGRLKKLPVITADKVWTSINYGVFNSLKVFQERYNCPNKGRTLLRVL